MSESKLNYDEKINETDKLNFIKEEKISEKVYYKIIKFLIFKKQKINEIKPNQTINKNPKNDKFEEWKKIKDFEALKNKIEFLFHSYDKNDFNLIEPEKITLNDVFH